MTNELHVVFGTGAIGLSAIEILAERGTPVRAVNRSGRAKVPDGVEVMGGDASDPEFATAASAGASVVYQCLNPPYAQWPQVFPPLQASVLEAASSAGAKYVAMDNLYAYGPTNGAILTEDLPYAATGSKGSTRARMAHDLLDAHRSGKLRVTIGQASDYFGPRGLLSAMGERVFYPAIAGKKAQVIGNPDQPHSYSYIPDIATSLVTLADHDEADGSAWHLPNAPAITTRQFVDNIYAAAGNKPQIQAISRTMVNVLGIFNGQVRELKEMLYEFEEPYIVDSSRFESTFDAHATPLDEAIPATFEWFRAHPRK